MRGQIAWDDDIDVDENLVVCSFLPHSTSEFSSYKPSPKGYRLHCGPGRLQLYDRHIANSFIYIGIQPRASGPEVVTSVALQKISKQVQLVSTNSFDKGTFSDSSCRISEESTSNHSRKLSFMSSQTEIPSRTNSSTSGLNSALCTSIESSSSEAMKSLVSRPKSAFAGSTVNLDLTKGSA